MGGYSHGKGLKSQIPNDVGYAVKFVIVGDVLDK
jgi:hypothetical protein